MAILKKRPPKVTCFYCNVRSTAPLAAELHPNGRVKHFQCSDCGADNHLDEGGEIADPVPSPTIKRAPRYGFYSASSASQLSQTLRPNPSLCARCQGNQLIIQRLTSEFEIPPEDHPDHDYKIKVLFPQYKREIEQKYPPVCEDCMPRVSQQIKLTNYNAKADVLGRMRARTDVTRAPPPPFSPVKLFLGLLWYARGVVWISSHLLVILWHGSSAIHPAGNLSLEPSTWAFCVSNSYQKRELDPACADVSAVAVRSYLYLSILGFFWLYRGHDLEPHSRKKLVGAREYWTSELITVCLRAVAWFILLSGNINLPSEAAARVHFAFISLNLINFIYAITLLRVEHPPRFSLRDDLPDTRVNLTPSPSPPPSTFSHPASLAPSASRQLLQPSRRLSPESRRTNNHARQSLTPPPSAGSFTFGQIPNFSPRYRDPVTYPSVDSPQTSPARLGIPPINQTIDGALNDADAMDWNPTSQPFTSPSGTPNRAASSSPFGQLRANTGIPAFSGRCASYSPPPASQSFARAPNLFNQPRQPLQQRTFLVPDTQLSRLGKRDGAHYDPLPAPQFNPPNSQDDTGLAGLLGGSLNLADNDHDLQLRMTTSFPSDGVKMGSSLAMVCRLCLLLSGTIAAFVISSLFPATVAALLSVLIASAWTKDPYFGIAGAVAAGARFLVEERNWWMLALATTVGKLGAEAWKALEKSRRERRRRFWIEEEKRKQEKRVKEEVRRERERERSQSPFAFSSGMALR